MGEIVVGRRTVDITSNHLPVTKAADFGCSNKVSLLARESIKLSNESNEALKQRVDREQVQAERNVNSLLKKISVEKGITEDEVNEIVENAVHEGKAVTAIQEIGISNLMQLIVAIQKLGISYRDQLKFCRREERDLQLKQMLDAAQNYKQQGKLVLNMAIGAGIAGILAGALPIAGYLKGEWIIDKLSSLGNIKYMGWFKNLEQFRDKPMTLFKNLSTMSQSSVTSQQMISQALTSFSESDRSRADKLGDMARTDGDEFTRLLQEMMEDHRQYKQFIEQVMQYEQNATSSLYR